MVLRLKKCDSFLLPKKIKKLLNKYKFVFNPSFVNTTDLNYLTIRVYDDSNKTIKALLIIWDNENLIREYNLTEYFLLKLGLIKIADPKMFLIGSKVYCTFNNGDRMENSNKIILFELNKIQIVKFYECFYPERTRIEKNWAFYIFNNEWHVLYSINPLKILKATSIEENSIKFNNVYIDNNQNFNNFSIGTQLLDLGDKYCFVAHKKYFFRRKRLYIGSLFELSKHNEPILIKKSSILIHSFISLLGEGFKFNKNLISCTYFSGIHKIEDNLILSYGINDIKWSLVKIKLSKIWR